MADDLRGESEIRNSKSEEEEEERECVGEDGRVFDLLLFLLISIFFPII